MRATRGAGAAWVLIVSAPLLAQWDPAKFHALTISKLAERARQSDHLFCDSQGCKLEHEVLTDLDLPYRNRKAKLIVTASSDPFHNCHPCGAHLSFFELELRNGQWTLTGSQFDVMEWGQFGKAYRQGIEVQMLSDEQYGVFLEGGSLNQGIIDKFTNVLTRVGADFNVVLSVQTAQDSTNGIAGADGDNWFGSVAVARAGRGMRDLLVTSGGIRDGKKFSQTDRYRFNGKEYVEAP